jgi:hypothetical protein
MCRNIIYIYTYLYIYVYLFIYLFILYILFISPSLPFTSSTAQLLRQTGQCAGAAIANAFGAMNDSPRAAG